MYKFQDKQQSDTVTNKPRLTVSAPSLLQALGISTCRNPMTCMASPQQIKLRIILGRMLCYSDRSFLTPSLGLRNPQICNLRLRNLHPKGLCRETYQENTPYVSAQDFHLGPQ